MVVPPLNRRRRRVGLRWIGYMIVSRSTRSQRLRHFRQMALTFRPHPRLPVVLRRQRA